MSYFIGPLTCSLNCTRSNQKSGIRLLLKCRNIRVISFRPTPKTIRVLQHSKFPPFRPTRILEAFATKITNVQNEQAHGIIQCWTLFVSSMILLFVVVVPYIVRGKYPKCATPCWTLQTNTFERSSRKVMLHSSVESYSFRGWYIAAFHSLDINIPFSNKKKKPSLTLLKSFVNLEIIMLESA